jgi:hypothetical protein
MEGDMTNRTRIASNEPQAVPPQPPPPLNDGTPVEAADQRYLETCAALFADATANRHLAELADNLVWTLAHIAVNCGVGVTGDMLRDFGNYVCRIEARRQAEFEAQQAKAEGRLPH